MRGIKFIPEGTKIDFIGKKKWAFGASLLLAFFTIATLCYHGLNLGIDFEGGILIEARSNMAQELKMDDLRDRFEKFDVGEITLQSFEEGKDILIRVQQQTDGQYTNQDAIDLILKELGSDFEVRRVELVGPQVGKELFRTGVFAMILAILSIAIYVGVRFEWQFAVAALVGLFHDIFLTLGLFSIFDLEFNLAIVAALLALAGYSINDKVVVFDRMRENLRRYNKTSLSDIINISVNQTLSRTLLTSITTLIAILPLLFFGGAALFNFSLALAWGIIVGTYSSIYIAAAMLLFMKPVRAFIKKEV